MSAEQTTPLNEGALTPDNSTPYSKEELIAAKKQKKEFYRNHIENIKPQVELMELKWKLAKYTYEHYQFSIELEKLQNGYENQKSKEESSDLVKHVVTEEDLANNPEMVTAGIKVGDTVKLKETPVDTADTDGSGND